MKFSALIIALAAAVVQADFFRNDFLPVGHVRTDAIINPNCLSDHVHTFYGPPLLYPKVTFDDLRESDPNLSSGNIMENQSLYWHPAVYHVAADGKKILQESGRLHLKISLLDALTMNLNHSFSSCSTIFHQNRNDYSLLQLDSRPN